AVRDEAVAHGIGRRDARGGEPGGDGDEGQQPADHGAPSNEKGARRLRDSDARSRRAAAGAGWRNDQCPIVGTAGVGLLQHGGVVGTCVTTGGAAVTQAGWELQGRYELVEWQPANSVRDIND